MTDRKHLDTFLLLALVGNIFILAIYRISTYDFWTHLATGRYLFLEGVFPSVNTFSYSYPQFPWQYAVGPFQLVLYLVYLVGGISGIIIYKAALLCLVFYFLQQISAQEDISALSWFFILYLAALVMRERFSVRPQLWFFLFAAYYVWVLFRYQSSSKKSYLISLLPMQLLWVNTHGSFLIGIYIVGLFAAVETLTSYFPKLFLPDSEKKVSVSTLWLILLGLIAVSMLNPYGYKVFLYPFGIGGQQVALLSVAERQPVGLDRLYGPYGILLAISVIAILRGLYRREWFLVLLVMTFLPMSIQAIRFIGIFSVIAAASLPRLLFKGISLNVTKTTTKTLIVVMSMSFITITTSYICSTHLTIPFGLGVNQQITPEGAADFFIENKISGPIYNDIDLGNYLIWRLYPADKVFIDGRRFSAYPKDFYEKVEFLHTGGPAWNALVRKYGFNVAVLGYTPINHRKLFPSEEWALVYWDDAAFVLLKRTPQNAVVIAKNEFKYFFPTRFSDLKVQDPGLLKRLFADLRRSRDQRPNSYRVNFALGYMYSWQGSKEQGLAENYLKKAISLCPPFAPAYAQLGLIYRNSGRYEEAIRYLKQSIKVAPEYRIAYYYLSTIYDILNDQTQAEKFMRKYNGT